MRGKHTSVAKELRKSVTQLEKHPKVKKVIIGISESCRHKYPPGTLRYIREVDGGIKFRGYTGNGVTDITVLTDDPLTDWK